MNIILVTIDALSMDAFGCYGNSAAKTPNIDALGLGGVCFFRHFSVASSTSPSHTSILTGFYPVAHGVRENGWVMKKGLPFISEVLRDSGFATVAATSVYNLGSFYGFGRGFEKFYDNSRLNSVFHKFSRLSRKVRGSSFNDSGRSVANRSVFWRLLVFIKHRPRNAEATTGKIAGWIKGNKKDFFAWIHYFDTHHYFGKETDARAAYDESISRIDASIGSLVGLLKENNLFNDTLFIITGDHGVLSFPAMTGHGHTVYEREINVPLILRHSRLPKKRVDFMSRSIDIMPTILDFAGLPAVGCDGVSLMPEIASNEPVVHEVYCEAYPGFADTKCIRTLSWKFILNKDGGDELYALDEDPEEKHNVVSGHPEVANDLRVRVKSHFGIGYDKQETDEYTRQMLRQLGYL